MDLNYISETNCEYSEHITYVPSGPPYFYPGKTCLCHTTYFHEIQLTTIILDKTSFFEFSNSNKMFNISKLSRKDINSVTIFICCNTSLNYFIDRMLLNYPDCIVSLKFALNNQVETIVGQQFETNETKTIYSECKKIKEKIIPKLYLAMCNTNNTNERLQLSDNLILNVFKPFNCLVQEINMFYQSIDYENTKTFAITFFINDIKYLFESLENINECTITFEDNQIFVHKTFLYYLLPIRNPNIVLECCNNPFITFDTKSNHASN